MNMIGHPKHVAKCLAVGADIICAQGGEGGGHTGDVPTTVLIPTVCPSPHYQEIGRLLIADFVV
jgi:NAD(P)H-dependent flavin oxidoreductase YrpB (nitropropane dioxygenase family)